ncbi:hypothetical protein B1C78_15225 [Thioalkalivibrio denitrificans]|uniref:Uncharacterized protein n=1 Tax=Thioalkalivibrio denitrificans TaxID=108003 RepID=A0A1V3NBA6_9GAMM|nr:hypothetical protein [Thioalkalivibrio denitrificans]OOG22325.1 hypothetical protein B1C78_15225 [Thioalkalivibrio denitrificans]
MKDFRIIEIIGLLRRTAPFLVFRFLIYIGITLAYVIGTGAGAGVGYGIGMIGDNPGGFSIWGGVIGFGVVGAVVYMLREYLLYMVKAGHIAVLVELMEGKALPEGRGQIDHAQKVVRERFVESSVLFAVDQLIKGILRIFNRTFFTIASLLPVPGMKGLVRFINTVINLSLTFLDEVILAYNIRTRSDNPWASSRTALILYAQNYKAFLKNAFFLAFFIWGMTFLVFLVILAPVAGLVALFPGTAGPLTLLIALVLAWGVKQAVIEPIGMTALMQVFFKVTNGQEPNAEWEARLEKLTGKFGELKQKALAWRGTQASAEPAPADAGG